MDIRQFISRTVNPDIAASIAKVAVASFVAPETVPLILEGELIKSTATLAGSVTKNLAIQIKNWADKYKIPEQELRQKLETYYRENTLGSDLFEEKIRELCHIKAKQLARHKKDSESPLNASYIRILEDDVFLSLFSKCVLTVDPANKQKIKKELLEQITHSLENVDNIDSILRKFDEEITQLQNSVLNDPILSAWQASFKLDYLIEKTDAIDRKTDAILGIYPSDELDIALQDYCDKISKRFGTISNATGKNEQDLPLDRFFMPLSLQVTEEENSRQTRRLGSLEELGTKTTPWLILGKAGDGKSTTFRWLTHKAFQEWKAGQERMFSGLPDTRQNILFGGKIPIPILCRDMDKTLLGSSIDKILMDYIQKLECTERSQHELLYNAFISQKEKGNLLFLIDGLDELDDPEGKGLNAFIERFLNTIPSHSGTKSDCTAVNSLIITSRPHITQILEWRLQQQIQIASLVSPSREDKINMIRNWVNEIYTANNACTEEQSNQYKKELEKAVTNDLIIRSLTDSPLLLLMLLVAFDAEKKIPSTERELYDKAVSYFIKWNTKDKESITQRYPKNLKCDDQEILSQLEYLALEMSIKRIQRLKEADVYLLLEDFRSQMEQLRSPVRLHLYKHRKIEDFLKMLKQHSGLFLPVENINNEGEIETWWEFRHLSFQDYLTACAIHHGYYIRGEKPSSIVEFIQEYFSDTSRELSYYFQHNPKKIISLFQSFYPDREGRNQILYQIASLFAPVSHDIVFTFFIPEWKGTETELINDYRKNKHNNTLVDRICILFLKNIEWSREKDTIVEEYEKFNQKNKFHIKEEITKLCSNSLKYIQTKDIDNALIHGLKNADTFSVKIKCASWLKGREGEEITAALIEALCDLNHDYDIRNECVKSLKNREGEAVTNALIEALLDLNHAYDVRNECVKSLKNREGEAVTNALIEALRDLNQDSDVRYACVKSLKDREGEAVTSALIEVLRNLNDDYDIRSECVNSLKDRKGEAVSNALIENLCNRDQDYWIRVYCVTSLEDRKGEAVAIALIDVLCDLDQDCWSRRVCATSLKGREGEAVTSALIENLCYRDQDSGVRLDCVESLKGREGESVASTLIEILRARDEDCEIRKTCASSLGFKEGKEVTNTLTQVAENDPDPEVRKTCLKSLKTIKKRSQTI